ncbi:bacteriocin [Fusicatenibacter sp.]
MEDEKKRKEMSEEELDQVSGGKVIPGFWDFEDDINVVRRDSKGNFETKKKKEEF